MPPVYLIRMDASTEAAESDVVYTLVERAAARCGADPLELEPLATVIDPELVTAFATSDSVRPGSELRFEYAGCEVRVGGTGELIVQRSA